MNPKIWTKAAYELLYQQLMERFGPYSEWKSPSCPSEKQRDRLNFFCESFASLIGAKSGDAVKLRIIYAVDGVGTEEDPHQFAVMTQSTCYALEAGFLKISSNASVTLKNAKEAA